MAAVCLEQPYQFFLNERPQRWKRPSRGGCFSPPGFRPLDQQPCLNLAVTVIRRPSTCRASSDYAAPVGSRRNFLTAKTVQTMKITITMICEIRNGGSEPVGASALSAGTFMKSCATSTKQFRYNAIIAVIT